MLALLDRFAPYLIVALAAFLAGWYGGLRWEKVNTLKAEAALAADRLAASEAEKALVESALAAQVRATAAARKIAEQNAAEAEAAEAAKAQKEMDLAAFAAELEAERAKEPPACSCDLTPSQRMRLRDRFPIRATVPHPGDPAPTGFGVSPVPRPGSVR